MPDKIRYEIEDRIGTIVIDSPPVNALGGEVIDALDKILDKAAGDESKVLIITGSGMFFSAGADVKEIAGISTSEDALKKVTLGQSVLNKVENFKKPIIAAINGICLGGGLELAMACHIRIASDMTKLGQPEITLGIIPGFGGTQRLPRLVGRAKAAELILTGDQITAKDALMAGLVNKITPPETLLKHAKSFAKKLASMGSEAMAEALQLITQSQDMTIAEGLKKEAEAFARLVETEDMKEGLKAFQEKRRPKFK